MRPHLFCLKVLLAALLSGSIVTTALAAASNTEKDEVLVYVADNPVTAHEIEQVIVSSPMADSFPIMDEKDQAALRGDILMRLINLNLLYEESLSLGLDQDSEYQKDLEEYAEGYVYKHYMDKLREGIKVPENVMSQMTSKLRGSPEAIDPAVAMYKSQQYKLVHSLALSKIKKQLNLEVFLENVNPDVTADTVIAKADDYVLRFGEISLPSELKDSFKRRDIDQYVYQKLEIDLVNKVARDHTENLDRVLTAFAKERLPALLIQKKEAEWIPDEQTAREFFRSHPSIGFEPEQRFISQIVFNDFDQAKLIKKKINEGESFHRMAQKYSIDAIGRKNAGQIGWVQEGSGIPEIEAAIKQLKDNDVSDIIKTRLGYHLVLIEGRKLGKQRYYEEIYDQVKQAMMQQNLPGYLKRLQHKYDIRFIDPVAKIYVDSH